MIQKTLFDKSEFIDVSRNDKQLARDGCFTDNMRLPIHRWYRYSAGFSADWVRSLLKEKHFASTDRVVLDPFAGIATTLLACNCENVKSIGFEAHPFIIPTIMTTPMQQGWR